MSTKTNDKIKWAWVGLAGFAVLVAAFMLRFEYSGRHGDVRTNRFTGEVETWCYQNEKNKGKTWCRLDE